MMFYFLKRVGCNYAILDSDDGVVDWIPKEELDSYIKDGISITGVDSKTGELKNQLVELSAVKCNWDGGENIFSNASSFSIAARTGKFELKASGSKKFKGKLIKVDDSDARLAFNMGVYVPISISVYDILQSRDHDATIQALKSLAV